MKIFLIVGLGSFLGGASRYGVWLIQQKFTNAFPYATLAVNIMGCFLIGAIFGWSSKGELGITWQFFLTTGILGGFTTFSAFSLETVNMLRSGQAGLAALYIGISVVMGLLATWAGLKLFSA